MSSITTDPSLRKVLTENAPQPLGPYGQGIVSPPFVFVSGCLGLDPKAGNFVEGVGKIVKTTVFVKDMNDFGTINAIYQEFFGEHKPARTIVEVPRIPRDALIAVEAIASVALT
ncbi:Endoribonuclease L-PSP/chorismate mutase-like protein [Russula emetica]|nr:Endoribonuclease L-PSP/chorismate mutase-like protein [Russula emetica]